MIHSKIKLPSHPPTLFIDADVADRHSRLIRQSQEFAETLWARFTAPLPTQQPFDWCVENLILDDPEVKGPFDPAGREYLRDPINDNNDDDVREQTLITGTGVGKTLTNIAGIAWKSVHHPCRGLMVMPSTKGEGGSETFATSRLIPAIEATPATAALLPAGQRRYYLNSKRIRLNGAHFGFVGANSSSQIASNRCGDIRMDEADKYKGRLGDEAGTASLVKERIEGVLDYQIFLNTTPTVETRLGWKSLLRSDFRRRFLPCPHCNSEVRGKVAINAQLSTLNSLTGWFDLAWTEQYCVIPNKFLEGGAFPAGTIIPRAFITWDKEAERKDGTMDLARVFRSTRFTCPHCGGHIRDEHKIWMDKNGLWLPLQFVTPHHRGYHLSSLYAPPLFSNENSLLGGRALKYLNAHEDGEGMKGFINSTLAEVDVSQEHSQKSAIEIVSQQPRISSVLKKTLMSCDHQQLYPKFWFVAWEWIVSVLRPVRTGEVQEAFLKQLPVEEKQLCEKLSGTLLPPKDALIYSPHWILAQLQRTDHWPKVADWLIGNGIVLKNLSEWYRSEFQDDLIRLLEWVCKQPGVNVALGRQGNSMGLEIGSADSWEELDDIQRRHKINNLDVIIDARFGEKGQAEVYAECYRRSPANALAYVNPLMRAANGRPKFSRTPLMGFKKYASLPWTPVLGHAKSKVWPGPDKIRLPYGIVLHDAFIGTADAQQFYLDAFEFDAQWALNELSRVRKKYEFGLAPNVVWTGNTSKQQPMSIAEFNLHLKGYYWDEKKALWIAPGKAGGSQSRAHPNHLYDCLKNMVAYATYQGIFKYTGT